MKHSFLQIIGLTALLLIIASSTFAGNRTFPDTPSSPEPSVAKTTPGFVNTVAFSPSELVCKGDSLLVTLSGTKTTVKLTDLKGKNLLLAHYSHEPGKTFSLNMPSSPAGTYLISLYDATTGDLLLAQRIVKP